MSDRKYYCFCADNCKFETMTKEQILAAIAQAAQTGLVYDPNAAIISKVKEGNANSDVTFWRGTMAQYNAIAKKDPNCFYIITDDTRLEDALKSELVYGPHNKPTYADVGAVPSGYTEGTFVAATAAELDNYLDEVAAGMKNNSSRRVLVYSSATATGLGTYSWFITVHRVSADRIAVEACAPSTDGIVAKASRVRTDGTWDAWEFDNPRMMAGTAYKTTERWGGRPVYQKIVTFGKLPSESTKTVAHGIANIYRIIDAQLFGTSSVMLMTNHVMVKDFVVDDKNVQIYGALGADLHSANVWIKYAVEE